MSILTKFDGHNQIRNKVAAAIGRPPPEGGTPEAVREWSRNALDTLGARTNVSLEWQPLCAVPRITQHAVADAVSTERLPPVWLGNPDPRFPGSAQRGQATNASTAALKILRVGDGSVVQFGRFGLITLAAENVAVSDLSCPEAPLAQLMDWDIAALRRNSYFHLGRALVITDRFWNANYAHWLLDGLSRLALLGPLRQGIAIVSTPIRFRWQSAMLAAVGVRGDDIVELDEYECFSARELYVADDVGGRVPHPAARAHPQLLGEIRHLCKAPLLPARGGGIILISRKRRDNRLIVNEDELLSLLQSRGLNVMSIELEDHSPVEQWQMFGSARAVVGVHGAGLANAAMMRPGATLLEILPAAYANPAFWMIASAVGVRYVGITDVEERNPLALPQARNISIPSKMIEAIGDVVTPQ